MVAGMWQHRNRWNAVAIACASSIVPASAHAQVQRISFAQAVELSLQQSTVVQRAESQVSLERTSVNEAKMQFWPDLRFQMSGSSNWEPSPMPKSKRSDPSRKNARFSSKKSGNRVRLVRRVSTSVSAKSVFTLPMAVNPPSR